jgi:hypothetical protein
LILRIIRDDKSENTRINSEFGQAKKEKKIFYVFLAWPYDMADKGFLSATS